MKNYSFFHPFYMSFYSRDLYRDAALRRTGTGYLHLFVLLALCWVVAIGKLQMKTAEFVDVEAPKVLRQLPMITVTDGKASIDEPMPYAIMDPDKHEPAVIIDTTGKTTSLEGSTARVLLTADTIYFRKSAVETRTFELKDIKEFRLDKEKVAAWLKLLKSFFAIACYPFALVFSYLYRIVQSLLYAAIGLLFAHILKVKLDLAASIRLAVVAVTPVILLDTLLGFFDVGIPFWTFICLLGALGYLWFGVKACAEGAQPPQPAPPAPPPAV